MLREYKAELNRLVKHLRDTRSDPLSIAADLEDLQQRARDGFYSERINTRSEEGLTKVLEAYPQIELGCMQAKIKLNEYTYKVLADDELPDPVVNVIIQQKNLEDSL